MLLVISIYRKWVENRLSSVYYSANMASVAQVIFKTFDQSLYTIRSYLCEKWNNLMYEQNHFITIN